MFAGTELCLAEIVFVLLRYLSFPPFIRLSRKPCVANVELIRTSRTLDRLASKHALLAISAMPKSSPKSSSSSEADQGNFKAPGRKSDVIYLPS